MKTTYRNLFGLALVAGFAAATANASIAIDWVTVGNANNAAQSAANRTHSFSGGDGYGAVAYDYQIAKNETTIGQYAAFLNEKAKSDPYSLYNENMTTSFINGISRSGVYGDYTYAVNPGSANKPITYVNWFDAARFCNWLHNGQGSGSTETGAYTLNGAMSGVNFTVNPGAKTWIPSENEWYKAAYYDPTKGGTGGYWLHANQSDTMAGNTIGVPNSANHYDGDYYVGYPGTALTDVGAYGANSDSFYGTNDQAGNVWEWNDTVSGSSGGVRGGSWGNTGNLLRSSIRGDGDPTFEVIDFGFRVASLVAIPEPAAMLSTLAFLAGGLLIRKRGKTRL